MVLAAVVESRPPLESVRVRYAVGKAGLVIVTFPLVIVRELMDVSAAMVGCAPVSRTLVFAV